MFSYLLRPKKFLPFEYKETVHLIDFQTLYQDGKRNVLIDLDNTLIPYDESVPNEILYQFFEALKQTKFNICIVSNNKKHRIKPFASAIDVPFVYSAKKPFKKGLKMALEKIDAKKDETVMIGDQIMTDVFAAKRLGIDAILVKPIKRKSEKWYTKINRIMERHVLRTIKKINRSLYDDITKE